MKYSLERSYEILDRSAAVLQALLAGLPDDWVMPNEGPETFSPYDVVGHLVHGERTNWIVRTKMILEHGNSKTFEKYDRFAQYKESLPAGQAGKGKPLQQLLDEFTVLRNDNMVWFKSLKLTEDDLDRKGMHPVLGEVTLRNLLSTWVVHDLTHMAQITRVMAKQYKSEMGPWPQFFRILDF